MNTRKVTAATLLLAATSPLGANAPAPDTIGNAPLYAIGVATADAEETARQYRRILGVIPQSFGVASNFTPSGKKVGVTMSVVFLSNFYVKLQQPFGGDEPFAGYLDKHGLSIMNLQIHVADALAVRRRLQGMGGKWVLGAEGDPWAYVDLKEEIGTIFEPINMLNKFPVNVDPAAKLPLGAMPVRRVGFAVTDVRESAHDYSNVLAIPEFAQTTWEGRSIRSDGKSKVANLKVASWMQGDVAIDLIQAPQGTPWQNFIKEHHGIGAYSVSFDVGKDMKVYRDQLVNSGARVVYETQSGDFVLFDLVDKLGFAVGLIGAERPH